MGILIPLPLFPTVPNVPGVPALLRAPGASATAVGNIALLTADSAVISQSGGAPQWGLFLNGQNVLNPDSIVGFEFKGEAKIASFPIEQGGFASYDKVQVPYDARIEMTKGGSISSRATFLNALELAKESLNLYTILTPELSIPNGNIVHYDYRRTSKSGFQLITVSVWVQEIRIAGTPAFSNTATPSGAAPQNGGTVQPTTPTPSQSSAITSASPPQPTLPAPPDVAIA